MRKSTIAISALAACAVWLPSVAQTIGTFPSVQPTDQTQNLVLPSTHTFQRLIQAGDPLSSGQAIGSYFDFTGYVPIGGSSTNGYLSISSETAFASVGILNLSFNNATKLWQVNGGGNVAFPFADLGIVRAFCAGTVAPNNHIIVCEETMSAGDGNGDGYNDDGWMIEIDPATRTVVNQDGAGGVDKLWAMGRQTHEDIAIKADGSVAYWSADNATYGYVYKFVPAVPGNFASGTLYVLQTSNALGTGTWVQVPNDLQADRNNTASLSAAAGAFNFNRVEGLELGPDGRVYFPSTTTGAVYRFRDLGPTVDQLDMFVAPGDYDVDGAGPYPPEAWGYGPDNIAFDGEGNLWVLQDGGRNHIWVVGPNHTTANPNIRLFATTPAGCEPTGITFSPDYKFLFLSIQHPNSSNTLSQSDAAGSAVVFNNHTALVIARKENLGTQVVLPLTFLSFSVQQQNDAVHVSWTVSSRAETEVFEVERSADGVHFSTIAKEAGKGPQFFAVDKNLPLAETLYYRIKLHSPNERFVYSEVRSIQPDYQPAVVKAYPVPAKNNLLLTYRSIRSATLNIKVVNPAGVVLLQTIAVVHKGFNQLHMNTSSLPAGSYLLWVEDGKGSNTIGFVK